MANKAAFQVIVLVRDHPTLIAKADADSLFFLHGQRDRQEARVKTW